MSSTSTYLAFDLGASNGRCILGLFDGERLDLDCIHRFENGSIELHGHLYWDILGIYNQVCYSLVKAGKEHRVGQAGHGELRAIGLDTWGCDFAFLDRQGKLVSNPYCYRDPQTAGIMPRLFERMPKAEIFHHSGLQFIEPNSLVQLFAMHQRDDPVLANAATFQHISDLMHYWLTGAIACEYTNASTSQILDAAARSWSSPIMQAFDLDPAWFPELVLPGTPLGRLRPALIVESGLEQAQVIATATHDTAAAIVATPVDLRPFAYISSGTWALLGKEIDAPLLSEACMMDNIANEGGAFGKITLLKNITSLWLIQECRRQWALEGKDYSWEELSQAAASALPFSAFLDPDDPVFSRPGNMPEIIRQSCLASSQTVPQTEGEVVRVILESLAFKYRYVLELLVELTSEPVQALHIIGGGSRNPMLNQFTANAIQMPVKAGPAEATALGNILVQMVATGELASLEQARELVRRSTDVDTYDPQYIEAWEEAYRKYLHRVGLD